MVNPTEIPTKTPPSTAKKTESPNGQSPVKLVGSETTAAVAEQKADPKSVFDRSRLPGGVLSVARHGAHLVGQLATVALGSSPVEPARGDRRFSDPTFTDNAIYRRIMQGYLAFSAEIEAAVEEPDLRWKDRELLRFLSNVLTSSTAPTNVLVGNPAAMKRAFETGGTSLALGLRNLVHDVRYNNGMPSQFKSGSLRVGEDLAVTPGAVVYRDSVCEVIQYTPTTSTVHRRPVLLIPPQIGKYYFMDLAPGRSFAEYAVSRGIPFFLISWRNVGPEDRDYNMDVYASSVLRAIDALREITGSDKVNTLGMCAGGILTSAILAHLADIGDDRINSASFGVTLLDFAEPSPVSVFNQPLLVGYARRRSSKAGVLDAKSLALIFNWMRPNDLIWNYFVNNYLLGKQPSAFDILAWSTDGTSLPSALHHQFLKIFNLNVLAEGQLQVLGSRVDLSKIDVDVYATGAVNDHLTPWKGCYKTTQLMSGDCTFVLSNAGHIASLVNPPGNPKAYYMTGPEPGPDPEAWRAEAQEVRGTWWEHWADWVLERSGEEIPAPTALGSDAHPVLEAAPGSYVLERIPEAI